ncbi:hypothetical protein GIB67_026872 [Kingdonia uniflora]|uniref:Uncharacterized protein n=1 Tax=Kingdonia uniflora TaxID=39325 RepID=A0A7J7M7T1_9MAGN|nr:hypothetical protein GIB67_026872 [Kingdonia uniflora]
MVRAPCCEKMGLKKGPWTHEEDQTLMCYIQRYGHGNWRALPKLAGLLRCGKSCRLRWTNYLRPDIKRGNFSNEEEETIINLHEILGNRWSAIAARLPGRTDNEIKNVWHTHLKKRLNKQSPSSTSTKQHSLVEEMSKFEENTTILTSPSITPASPQQSSSDFSSNTESSSFGTVDNRDASVKNIDSSENYPELGEDFWPDVSSMENFSASSADLQFQNPFSPVSTDYGFNVDESMDYWYNLFIKAGEVQDLVEF